MERVHEVRARDGAVLSMTELGVDAPLPAREAFLLVHGFAQDRRAYSAGPLPDALLARGARVFLGELRGHGRSVHTGARDWTITTLLEQDLPALWATARALLPAQARLHYVGHSLGGMLGYAALAGRLPFTTLTTFAAPLRLGAGRPLVRAAGAVFAPLARLAAVEVVPMDLFLGALARPLSRPRPGAALGAVQALTRLVNPRLADPDAVELVLSQASPEAPAVFRELAAMAALGGRVIAGVDLEAAALAGRTPILAVVGERDIFAPEASVRALLGAPHARVHVVPGACHVDLLLGGHAGALVERWWPFWAEAEGRA